MDFDQSIKEDALFNYAKVTYELSYTPFNEAIRALIIISLNILPLTESMRLIITWSWPI